MGVVLESAIMMIHAGFIKYIVIFRKIKEKISWVSGCFSDQDNGDILCPVIEDYQLKHRPLHRNKTLDNPGSHFYGKARLEKLIS